MSMHGAGQCLICGAWSDYCELYAASGVRIDCRNLQLKNLADLARNIELAKSLRESVDHATGGEHDAQHDGGSDHTSSDEQSHGAER